MAVSPGLTRLVTAWVSPSRIVVLLWYRTLRIFFPFFSQYSWYCWSSSASIMAWPTHGQTPALSKPAAQQY
jgi:hypothetical protein